MVCRPLCGAGQAALTAVCVASRRLLTPPLFLHVICFGKARAVAPWVFQPITMRQNHLSLVGCSYATFVPMGIVSEVQPSWCIVCLLDLAAAVQLPCRAHEVKEGHFWYGFGGGVDKRKIGRSAP